MKLLRMSHVFLRQIDRKQENLWIGEGEHAKPVVRRNQFEPKIMVSVFFKLTGLAHIHCLEKGETLNDRRLLGDSNNSYNL